MVKNLDDILRVDRILKISNGQLEEKLKKNRGPDPYNHLVVLDFVKALRMIKIDKDFEKEKAYTIKDYLRIVNLGKTAADFSLRKVIPHSRTVIQLIDVLKQFHQNPNLELLEDVARRLPDIDKIVNQDRQFDKKVAVKIGEEVKGYNILKILSHRRDNDDYLISVLVEDDSLKKVKQYEMEVEIDAFTYSWSSTRILSNFMHELLKDQLLEKERFFQAIAGTNKNKKR